MTPDDEALQRISREAGALSDSWREHWRLHYQGEIQALKAVMKTRAAKSVLARLDDGVAMSPVINTAMELCRDALGDDVLWVATTPLRDALTTWNSGIPPHADSEYWRTREDNNGRI